MFLLVFLILNVG
jgi:hypothetical protein